MKFTVIIPARYASERLPGKPLLDIAGWPMIRHVHARASESNASRTIIATDDKRIADAVRDFGGEVCMTRSDHRSGTDRLYDVVTQLKLSDDEIIVNVQGDEPLIPPANINQVAANLHAHAMAGMATLCEPIHDKAQFTNPNTVKVVCDARGYALYFSRAPIPWPRDAQLHHTGHAHAIHAHRHIGIYAYRVEFLREFVQWAPAPLEVIESLEQLRALHNGVHIHVAEALKASPPGVDTAEDLAHIRTLIKPAGK